MNTRHLHELGTVGKFLKYVLFKPLVRDALTNCVFLPSSPLHLEEIVVRVLAPSGGSLASRSKRDVLPCCYCKRCVQGIPCLLFVFQTSICLRPYFRTVEQA